MQPLVFVFFHILPLLCHLSRAATVPKPSTLLASNDPFNLSSYHHDRLNVSAIPLPHLPFRYTIPGTQLNVVFTAFGRGLKDVDVWPTFIDATSFAIDGMVHDGYQPVPAAADLRWRQGGAELSITKTPQLTYNILATSIAAVHDVGMTYGIYATDFEIRAANQRLGTGQLAFRLAEPSPANTDTNSTATARRDLGSPPDPYWMSVYNTPIQLKFSTYKGGLPTPFILDSLVIAIFTAASAIRDNRGDLHIRKAWLWERAVRLTCYPRPDMSWRNLASAVVGMKWFVLREGGSLDFKYEVYFRPLGNDRIAVGRMAVMQ